VIPPRSAEHVERRRKAIAALGPYIERARRFSGWNFDDLDIRNIDPEPPWDYVARARGHATAADRVLDLGTGGGEVYSRIVEGIDAQFVAAEEWHVNAPVARDRLAPLGVAVVRGQAEYHHDQERRHPTGPLPFRDGAFDLVLSRHEGIMPAEIDRILAPGGTFFTQQVAHRQWEELRAFFPRMTVWPDHFREYRRQFEALGFEVDAQEYDWRASYPLTDLAYTLLVCSWELVDFDPVAEIDTLLAAEDALGGEHGLVVTLSRYIMTARKP
jgi:SAM-dependent methyltransferase